MKDTHVFELNTHFKVLKFEETKPSIGRYNCRWRPTEQYITQVVITLIILWEERTMEDLYNIQNTHYILPTYLHEWLVSYASWEMNNLAVHPLLDDELMP